MKDELLDLAAQIITSTKHISNELEKEISIWMDENVDYYWDRNKDSVPDLALAAADNFCMDFFEYEDILSHIARYVISTNYY